MLINGKKMITGRISRKNKKRTACEGGLRRIKSIGTSMLKNGRKRITGRVRKKNSRKTATMTCKEEPPCN